MRGVDQLKGDRRFVTALQLIEQTDAINNTRNLIDDYPVRVVANGQTDVSIGGTIVEKQLALEVA